MLFSDCKNILILHFRYDTAYWNSDIDENCILSTVEMSRIGSAQRKMIDNDKDWDLYSYDKTIQSCRDTFRPGTSNKGNASKKNLNTCVKLKSIIHN